MIFSHTLTERQRRFVGLADELGACFAVRAPHYDHTGEFPFENYTDLHQSGYLRLVVPGEYGGEGADVFEMVLAQEHLAHGDGATAMAVNMLIHLVGHLNQQRFWPEPIFAEICRAIVNEGALINAVMSEPDLGSASRGGMPQTTARPTADGWLINGHKIFVTMAPVLRYFVVSVYLEPSRTNPQGEVASAIVQAGTPGIRQVDTWRTSLSLRTCGNYDVYFENVFVADAWLINRRPIHQPPPPPWFSGWNLTMSAVYLGIGQAACDAACVYAQQRVPSSLGKPIAELPKIQQQVGEMQIHLDAARAVLYDAAHTWVAYPERRTTLAPQIATAKYLCTNAASAATDTALRVAGGFGLTSALPLERYFRDARAGLFHPPQDDLALTLVGRTRLDTYKNA